MELIPHEIEEYAEQHTTPESAVLAELTRETNLTQVYPRMLSGHLQGTLLRMISRMVKPFRVLEIGTFTGYSAINLAAGLTDRPESEAPSTIGKQQNHKAYLHTIEVDPEQETIIQKYFRKAGAEEKIILHIGDASKVIPGLDEYWDLVFIDADKPNYLSYYKMVIDRVRPGGWIIADNALWDGKVLDPGTRSADARGIIAFNDFVLHDGRVENVLLPLRDGLMLIRKNETAPKL
jgi:caffeoyl-CoA O-methyltransferase